MYKKHTNRFSHFRLVICSFAILALTLSLPGFSQQPAAQSAYAAATDATTSSSHEEHVVPSTTITSNSMRITFVEKVDNADSSTTWVYEVEELSAMHDLTDLTIETPGCTVSATSPASAVVASDTNSGLEGASWSTTPDFEKGEFSITVSTSATLGMVMASVQAPDVAYGELAGPRCDELEPPEAKPMEPSPMVITESNFRIGFVGSTVNPDGTTTWTYQVDEHAGAKDLEAWVLEMPGCEVVESKLEDYTDYYPGGEYPGGDYPYGEYPDGEYPDGDYPDGDYPDGDYPEDEPEPEPEPEPEYEDYEVVAPDKYTGLYGLRWKVKKDFFRGLFTFTLAHSPTLGMVNVAAQVKKDVIDYATIAGPRCDGVLAPPSSIGTVVQFEGVGFLVGETAEIWVEHESGFTTYLAPVVVSSEGSFKIYTVMNIHGAYTFYARGKQSKIEVKSNYIVAHTSLDIPHVHPAPPPKAKKCQSGIFYAEYFENKDMQGVPGMAECGKDGKIFTVWGKGGPHGKHYDEFSMSWTTEVKMKRGRHRLRMLVDDGVRISINGKRVFSSWQLNPASIYESDFYIPVEALYTVEVDYFENTGIAALQTLWCAPGENCPLIPHPCDDGGCGQQGDDDDDDDDDDDRDDDDMLRVQSQKAPIVLSEVDPDQEVPDGTRVAPVTTYDAASGPGWVTDVNDLAGADEVVYLPFIVR